MTDTVRPIVVTSQTANMSFLDGCLSVAPPPPPLPPPLNKFIDSNTVLNNGPLTAVRDCNHMYKKELDSTELVKEKCGTKLKETFSSPDIESRKACKYLLHLCGVQDPEEYVFISSYLPVTPVLQNGPRCGLVALAMASELTNSQPVSTEQIFHEAQKKGYSKQGEMFMAQALEKLCSDFLTCSVCHIQSNQDGKVKSLISSLLKKDIVLIPYDSDKDHSPCNKRGHKAHWALLTGFFTMLRSKDVPDWLIYHCVRDSEIPFLYYWPNSPPSAIFEQTTEFMEQYWEHLYVFGHHGKSKYAGLWHVQKLLISNDNLVEVGPDRHSEKYVIPLGGIEAGLRGQFIIIDRSSDGTAY